MAKFEVKTEKANGKVYKVIITCEGLEISFIPQIIVKQSNEKKIAKESSRIYSYGGELTRDKMKLNSLTEKKIRQLAWAIFFKQGERKKTERLRIPGEKAILKEAYLINEKVTLLKKENPSMSWTEALKTTLKKLTTPITLSPREIAYLTYFQKNLFFDLNKHGLKVTKEGWIIITRKENRKSIKVLIFNVDSAINMQDEILNSYLSSAQNACAEIPKIKVLQEMVENINNLLADWSIGKEKKEELKKRISSLVEDLSLCRNQFKVDSKETLESIFTLKDSLGRENPGAFAAKTISVIHKLENRLEEINRITPIIENRKIVLKIYRSTIETQKMRAIMDLDKLIRLRNFSYYANVNPIRINQIIYILESLILAPYSNKKMQAIFYLEAAKDCILETRKAKKLLRTALAILQD